MGDEQIGQRGVVGAIAAIAGGIDRSGRREEAGDGLHVLTEVDDAHGGGGIASPFACAGKPLPFQRSKVKRSASRTGAPKSRRWTSMSATSHPDLKLWTAHAWAVCWII
jgi:hypothetical protein